MPVSDIYSLTVKQRLFGKPVENVFFYEKLDPEGTAEDLRAGWQTLMSVAMVTLQASAVSWVSIDTTNLGDLSDFEKHPVTQSGLAGSSDCMPAFNAVGYTLNPATRAVRPGSKRIAGVLEAVATNGVFTEPTFVDNMEDFRILLDDNVVGALSEYQPVIVKRIKTAVPDTVPQQYTYRLPETGDTLVLGLVKSATSNIRVTSQTSRKAK